MYVSRVNVDGVTFDLSESQSFEWLSRLGRVFCVFDQQDSGNLSFGVQVGAQKQFVKYAGARTIQYTGDPTDAIKRLKHAVTVYEHLRHRYLTNLVNHFEVENGYVAVFEWFDGECLHPHFAFPAPKKYTHPESPYYRFRQLPVNKRLEAVDAIFEFHAHVEALDYVAIDFYDGSILYDLATDTVKICDIDLYQKKPFTNHMGRMWGSRRFMSPEEFNLGAPIDARTNVFNMGAVAFGLLGGELDRSLAHWDASEQLYKVAQRAVQTDRAKRFASVAELNRAWVDARRESRE